MNEKIVVLLVVLASGCAAKKSAAADPVLEHGRRVYGQLCATCHGVGGNGYVADNAPSLRSPTFLATASIEFLRAGITRGRPGTAMAAYGRALGGPLGPEDVSAVVAFLREGGPPRVDLPSAAPGAAPGDAKNGKVLYETLCMRCHGTPTQRSSAVHLANPVLLATASDAFLRWAVESGRPPTSMIPWKETLRPAQIDDVIAYVRSLAVPPGLRRPPPRRRARPRRAGAPS